MAKHKENFFESSDGRTFVKRDKEESVTQRLIQPFSSPQEMIRLQKAIGGSLKRLKKDPLDKVDTEYVDVDETLNCYVE
jgi:hypothetical protein